MKESKWNAVRDVATHLAAFDVVLTCLLDSMAKTQPAIARAIARDIRAHADRLDAGEFRAVPGVSQKSLQYALLIETTLAAKPQ